jgi:hypothetical protein
MNDVNRDACVMPDQSTHQRTSTQKTEENNRKITVAVLNDDASTPIKRSSAIGYSISYICGFQQYQLSSKFCRSQREERKLS